MKSHNLIARGAWLKPRALDAATACLKDNLQDDGLNERIRIIAQEIVSWAVSLNPEAAIKDIWADSSNDLALKINKAAKEHWDLDGVGPLAWCDITAPLVEEARTARELAAICGTRILPINDPDIAMNAAQSLEHAV